MSFDFKRVYIWCSNLGDYFLSCSCAPCVEIKSEVDFSSVPPMLLGKKGLSACLHLWVLFTLHYLLLSNALEHSLKNILYWIVCVWKVISGHPVIQCPSEQFSWISKIENLINHTPSLWHIVTISPPHCNCSYPTDNHSDIFYIYFGSILSNCCWCCFDWHVFLIYPHAIIISILFITFFPH